MMGPHITLAPKYKAAATFTPQITGAASQDSLNLGAEDLLLGLTLLNAVTFLAHSFLICKTTTRVSLRALAGRSLTR